MAGDPQEQRVYQWERQWKTWNREALSLPKCREIVRTACNQYGVDVPTVTGKAGDGHSEYSFDKITIRLLPRHLNAPSALHETGHHIVHRLYGIETQWHGPEWLGVYMWLLEKHGIAPRTALVATALEHRLRWLDHPPEDIP